MKKTQRFIICFTLLFMMFIGQLSAATVRGYVRNYNGNSPIIEALVAIEPQKGTEFRAQTMTDRDGFFEFKEVPEGTYKIAGMKECFYSNSLFDFYISDEGVYNVKVKLIENPKGTDDMSYCFMIGGIEVEAAGRDIVPEEIATTRKIDAGEIDHLQASNLGDVLTLVPGVEKSGQMGLASQQNVGLRKVKRSDSGLYGFDSFGTSVVVDGNEISGDMQASGYVSGTGDQSGTDLRTIPADNIKSVEVITGIASVEYGNFTDGIVKVETKKGSVNRRFKAKFNPDTKGFSYNGGYKFGDDNTVFDYHVNYSYSERDLREIGDEYQRIYGSANLSRSFLDDKLDSRLGLTYTRIFDDTEPNNEYHMQNTDRGFSTSGKLDLKYTTDNNVRYELLAGLDYKNEDVVKQKMVTDQLFLPMDADISSIDQSYCTITPIYDTVYVADSDTIDYIDSSLMVYPYNATATQNGEEWDVSFKLKRKSTVELGKTKNNLLFGFETDYEKNTGEGVVLDSVFNYYGNESTKRSYSFDNFPANIKFSIYAEDKISFKFFKRKMDILIGLRYDLINPEKFKISFDEGFSLFDAKQGDFFSPRFNIKYQISDDLALRMGVGQSVKSVSLTQIYKVPMHIAYLDTSTNQIAEKIFYQINENLKSYVSQKAEGSLDWRINDLVGTSLTGYYSHTKDRPQSVNYPDGYDINPDTINIQYIYSIYENAGWADDYGAELTFRTKRINDLKYALNAIYRFSRTGSDASIYDSDYQATSSNWELWYPKYVEWQSKLVLDGQISYLNQRFGLWVTMDVQYTPFYKRQKIFSSVGVEQTNEYGDAYINYQGMSYWYDAEMFNYTGQWLMNLRLSKSLGNNAEVSLYINNFFDNRATYVSPFTGSQINLNSPIYYGLEMSVQL
ncbi:MAG: TonB-dependent receptor [Candidatus Marinimicrobia bacterium]|nr:TonB-dependent receptor [Candidatus Neomarinimicrobiota bacterium]